jgi:hypothetical protein
LYSLLFKKGCRSCGWWYIPITPAFWRLRQEDCEFVANLFYILSSGQPQLHGMILSVETEAKQNKTKCIKVFENQHGSTCTWEAEARRIRTWRPAWAIVRHLSQEKNK